MRATFDSFISILQAAANTRVQQKLIVISIEGKKKKVNFDEIIENKNDFTDDKNNIIIYENK